MPETLHHGVGAVCSVLLRRLHPLQLVQHKFPNAEHQQRLDDLICIRKEIKKVSRRDQMCYVFRHDVLDDNQELHCVCRWSQVKTPPMEPFEGQQEEPLIANEGAVNERIGAIPVEILMAGGTREDIQLARAAGFEVDDDNEPAPENVPVETEHQEGNTQQQWGWQGIDHWKSIGGQTTKASLIGLSGIALEGQTIVSMFLLFFLGKTFLEDVIIQKANTKLEKMLNIGEFLRYLGLWLIMSTMKGFKKEDFWSSRPISLFDGAPYRFDDIGISMTRFDEITAALSFTTKEPPTYLDKFFFIRQMITQWNKNMGEVFCPSWVSCLDESMSKWTNRWTCPGWMFVPRKPHPFGNEYHSICCALSGIMFQIEIVEGKDAPKDKPPQEFSNFTKTTALMLQLTKPIHAACKVVILDSGFCVLEALIKLRQYGVFASALIKKRKYWPKHVPGNAIDAYMAEKEVGSMDSLNGKMDNTPYDIFVLKEPDYSMKIMSTYGGLIEKAGQHETTRTWKENGETKTTKFKYKEPFANHYDYRHCVDDHNHIRHGDEGISIEDTWKTTRWEIRVFTFLLAISEVNVYLAFKYFMWKGTTKMTMLQFRRQLAFSLIYNDYLKSDDDVSPGVTTRRKRKHHHSLVTCPPHAAKYERGKWTRTSKKKHQQFKCRTSECKNYIRTSCECDIGNWMCIDCFQKHIIDVMTVD